MSNKMMFVHGQRDIIARNGLIMFRFFRSFEVNSF